MFYTLIKWHNSLCDWEKGGAKVEESFCFKYNTTLKTYDTVYLQQILKSFR